MMILAVWVGLTIVAFWLAHRKFYLSGTIFLCSTTLLAELGSGIYIWDIFFLYLVFNTVFFTDFTVKKSHTLFILMLICFLTLNALLSGEYFSLIEVGRLLQISIFCIFLYSHYSKRPIENVFIYVIFVSLIINICIHFLQIFKYEFAWSLKPTGSKTIGGFFNDSSEFGPIALLCVFIFYADYLNTKTFKLYGLPILAACFAVVLSFNRTSFMLLPIFAVSVFVHSKLGVKAMVVVFIMVIVPFGIGYSNKNFELVHALFNDPSSLLGGTIELRIANWQTIFEYYVNHCNVLFGCAPGFFDVNRDLFTSGYGVFAVDNGFLRIIVSYGILGSVWFIAGMSYLFSKTKRYASLWLILLGLGMMIELFKSLPVALVLICCFSYLLSNKRQNIVELK